MDFSRPSKIPRFAKEETPKKEEEDGNLTIDLSNLPFISCLKCFIIAVDSEEEEIVFATGNPSTQDSMDRLVPPALPPPSS